MFFVLICFKIGFYIFLFLSWLCFVDGGLVFKLLLSLFKLFVAVGWFSSCFPKASKHH